MIVKLKITIKNLETNFIVKGNGENIVLLHGWGSNIGLFEKMIEHLSKYCRVYALDMPGFGGTDEPQNPWCLDDYVDFVIEFIKSQNIDNTVLLGHSFGGRVIIKMSNIKSLPFKVSKIILVDSAGILPKKTLKKKLKQRMYKLTRWALNLSFVKKAFPEAIEELRKKNGSADYNAASPIMRQVLVKVVNEDLEPLLSNIQQETLLIWGDKDTATPLSDGQKMEKLIKNSGLVTVKGAGHYSYLEQFGLVHRVLDAFLNNR
jgi:pimeloyl-ACP methyl ester carboxylesterase